MNILLTTLNSKYVHSNLALKYLYNACSEKQRENMRIREFTINNTDEMIFVELMRSECDSAAFSCYIWNIEKTLRIAGQLKAARPEVKIILGGPEVSFDSGRLMEDNPFIDYVISGEGEASLPRLLEVMEKQAERENPDKTADMFMDIQGLSYRTTGGVKVNPPAEMRPFSEAPFPYENNEIENDKVLYYESSRGCPFSCSYCLSSVMKGVRPLPVDRVKREILYFIEKSPKQVKFIDRTFNYDKKRCAEVISFIIEWDNGVTNFHFELCGDLIDDELINLLKSARKGLFQFEIGVQSANSSVLAACGRRGDFSAMAGNIKKIIRLGTIHIHLDLIAGLPGESYDMFRDSFNEVFSLRPDALQLGFLKMLKGSPIRKEAAKYGYMFRSTPPYEVISNDFISAQELVRLKMIENVFDLWYNRGGFFKTLEYVFETKKTANADALPTPFDVFESLADFFYDNGFQNRSHKKEDLYRIFFKFAGGEDVKMRLKEDMDKTLNFDAVKKFIKKGWDII